MADPLFSVVIPSYNVEKYLSAALSSIKAQGISDWEAIVVDDCSVDATLSIARKISEDDRRIRVYALSENRGASQARNFGMGKARGAYVLFLDADDVLDAELFSILVPIVHERRPQMVVWGIQEEYFDKSGTLVMGRSVIPVACACQTSTEVRREIIALEKQTLFGYAWNKLYLRDVIEDAGALFPDAAINEDVFFNIAVAKSLQSMVVVDKALYRYARRDVRDHKSLTSRYIPNYFSLSARRVSELYDLYRREGEATDEVKGVLGAIYLRYALSALQRNCAPEAHMTRPMRREWLDGFYQAPLSRALIEPAQPEGTAARAFAWLFKRKSRSVLLFAAHAVCVVSTHLPRLFSRVKQSR